MPSPVYVHLTTKPWWENARQVKQLMSEWSPSAQRSAFMPWDVAEVHAGKGVVQGILENLDQWLASEKYCGPLGESDPAVQVLRDLLQRGAPVPPLEQVPVALRAVLARLARQVEEQHALLPSAIALDLQRILSASNSTTSRSEILKRVDDVLRNTLEPWQGQRTRLQGLPIATHVLLLALPPLEKPQPLSASGWLESFKNSSATTAQWENAVAVLGRLAHHANAASTLQECSAVSLALRAILPWTGNADGPRRLLRAATAQLSRSAEEEALDDPDAIAAVETKEFLACVHHPWHPKVRPLIAWAWWLGAGPEMPAGVSREQMWLTAARWLPALALDAMGMDEREAARILRQMGGPTPSFWDQDVASADASSPRWPLWLSLARAIQQEKVSASDALSVAQWGQGMLDWCARTQRQAVIPSSQDVLLALHASRADLKPALAGVVDWIERHELEQGLTTDLPPADTLTLPKLRL